MKAQADTVETIASAELKRAQTIETLEKAQREGDMAELDAIKYVKEIWRG
jgi:NADH:ubiquinone oxidoreductase subunit E